MAKKSKISAIGGGSGMIAGTVIGITSTKPAKSSPLPDDDPVSTDVSLATDDELVAVEAADDALSGAEVADAVEADDINSPVEAIEIADDVIGSKSIDGLDHQISCDETGVEVNPMMAYESDAYDLDPNELTSQDLTPDSL